MNRNEVRHRLISAMLQADGPLAFSELVAECDAAGTDVRPVLTELITENLVVEGKLLPDASGPLFRWGASWAREIGHRTAASKRELRGIVAATGAGGQRRLEIGDEPAVAFHDYVVNEYKPPRDKRFLVVLQCSVRRPFSSSPSHASMRRAIAAATGCDPSEDFEMCPVHVVVLASKIGPVPYELEDVYPANLRGGGVKHFNRDYYAHVKPILAERMAQYIIAHKDSYDRITTFTEGRYGEVMEEARKIAPVDFLILPVADGPRIIQMGRSTPRKYWERYWIQLFLEIVSWLDADAQAGARARLDEMNVRYDRGSI